MIFKTRSLSLLATLAFGLCASAAHAADTAGAISAHDAWVRWLPGKLPAAGYLTLDNHGDKPVALVEVDSDDYGMTMLHQTVKNGSASKMEMVDKLDIPAHGSVAIAPGGYHLMLEDAQHPIKPGDTVHMKLSFSDGETLTVPFAVKTPAQTQ
jgi:periplasmic copper chaperone A